jgi:hypothetical protein
MGSKNSIPDQLSRQKNVTAALSLVFTLGAAADTKKAATPDTRAVIRVVTGSLMQQRGIGTVYQGAM